MSDFCSQLYVKLKQSVGASHTFGDLNITQAQVLRLHLFLLFRTMDPTYRVLQCFVKFSFVIISFVSTVFKPSCLPSPVGWMISFATFSLGTHAPWNGETKTRNVLRNGCSEMIFLLLGSFLYSRMLLLLSAWRPEGNKLQQATVDTGLLIKCSPGVSKIFSSIPCITKIKQNNNNRKTTTTPKHTSNSKYSKWPVRTRMVFSKELLNPSLSWFF